MAETNAFAIKLPTFWAQQPEVWFLQAEAQFHIRKITDDTTKYYHVVAALDQETSGRVLRFKTETAHHFWAQQT